MSRMKKKELIVRRVTDDFTAPVCTAAPVLLFTSKFFMKSEQEQQQQQTFPFKLYEMIEHAHESRFTSALSWLSDGNAFFIHDKHAMMNDLAPMFFKQTKFRSFTRQLNIWGFERVGPGRDVWKHKEFLRGQPDLLEKIVRTEIKTGVKRKNMLTVSSNNEENASSRTARNAIIEAKNKCSKSKIEIVADDSSFSSSRARAHSQDLLSCEEGHSAYKQGQEAAGVAESETEAISRSSAAGTSTSNNVGGGIFRSLPLDDHESMYLANIFDKHERERPSHEDVLCSILSLDRETIYL